MEEKEPQNEYIVFKKECIHEKKECMNGEKRMGCFKKSMHCFFLNLPFSSLMENNFMEKKVVHED